MTKKHYSDDDCTKEDHPRENVDSLDIIIKQEFNKVLELMDYDNESWQMNIAKDKDLPMCPLL